MKVKAESCNCGFAIERAGAGIQIDLRSEDSFTQPVSDQAVPKVQQDAEAGTKLELVFHEPTECVREVPGGVPRRAQ